jgi:predicted transcriptional regulator of viral defense system
MKVDIFLAQHAVFTFDEIFAFLAKDKDPQPKNSTIYNLLTYHQKQGHIARVRKGLYTSVPKGVLPGQCPIDPFLIASKMADDAILGYCTALDLFGKLHTVRNEFIYISKKRETKSFLFRDVQYKAVSIPTALKKAHQEQFGVQSVDRLGQKIRVTSLERTLVDILDRPHLCGSWEEIWRSLENIEYFDIDQVLKYALLLSKRTTIAKLGVFFDAHRDRLMIPDGYFEQLLMHRPQKPFYLIPNQKIPQKMVAKWNVIVPLSLLNREWEEPHENI